MQLMIDTLQETPAALRLAAKFFSDHAALREAMEREANVPAGTPPAPQAPDMSPPPPPPPPPNNVVPLVPPPPPPAPSNVVPLTTPLAPPAPLATATTTLPTLTPDEHDSAGMPWDARIHQKTKSKKKDGTWKLQKGINQALVITVTQELSAQGRMGVIPLPPTAPSVEQPNPMSLFGRTPLPVGASAPVPLPPPPPGASFGQQGQSLTYADVAQRIQTQADPYLTKIAQDIEAAQAQGTQVPPPPPSVSLHGAAVPVPPAPNVGVSDAPVLPVVSAFRALVSKITEARLAGKISPDQVNGAVAQAGAPSLQMLSSMSHLVPVVDAHIDAAIALAG